ncbi:MAG: hypothetical protein HY816_01825 [Candidatus Wallbacteria bacterium]|nr:hypothetical protein [Candidatus Wallbacteria bacterium]
MRTSTRPLVLAALAAAHFALATTAQQAPNADDLVFTPRAAPAAPKAAEAPIVLKVALQTGQSPFEHKVLGPDETGGMAGNFRERLDWIRNDPLVLDLARRVTNVWPKNPIPPVIVLSGTEKGAYFNHSFVVLGQGVMGAPPGQRDDSARGQKRRREAFRNTVLHELGHFLQFRLYSSWLPPVDYSTRELANSDSPEHWFDKETTLGSAWTEGFAEALAAFLGSDERIEEFRYRRPVYYGIRNPREPHRLATIEGHVAFALYDFWGPKGQSKAFERTLAVLRLSDHRAQRTEHHGTFDAYLAEHLQSSPEDAVRWELVLRANSLMQEGAAIRAGAMEVGKADALSALSKGLAELAARHGVDRVSQGIVSALREPGGVSEQPQAALAAVRAAVTRLAAAGQAVFTVPESGGATYETMPIAELEKAVQGAHTEFDTWFRHYGYDFHPKVREAKERWQKLEAILVRRRGK